MDAAGLPLKGIGCQMGGFLGSWLALGAHGAGLDGSGGPSWQGVALVFKVPELGSTFETGRIFLTARAIKQETTSLQARLAQVSR